LLNLSPAPAEIRTGTAAGGRFLVPDSWRGICALMVALFHFPTRSMFSQSAFVGGAYLFVDFFFVLPGFVIASSYGSRLSKPDELARFALVRLGRIYPLHFFDACRLRRLRGGTACAPGPAWNGCHALHRRLRSEKPRRQSLAAAGHRGWRII